MTADSGAGQTLDVVVMSHRPEVREAVMSAVGRRPARDLPRLSFTEAEGIGDVLGAADGGRLDLAVLDAEAQPTGGMGVCRQLKNERDRPGAGDRRGPARGRPLARDLVPGRRGPRAAARPRDRRPHRGRRPARRAAGAGLPGVTAEMSAAGAAAAGSGGRHGPDVARPARSAAARRGPRRARGGVGDGPDDVRGGLARPGRRVRRGAARQGGDRRGDRWPRRGHARARAGGDGRRRRRRHRRHRRRPGAHREHLDDGRGGHGGRGRAGGQARRAGRVVRVRVGGPARGARRARRPRPRGGRGERGPGRHRVLLRPDLPPGDAPRRRGAARDRRADGVQPARPAHQPGAPGRGAHRLRRRAVRPGARRRARRPRRHRPGGARRRRARRDHHDDHHDGVARRARRGSPSRRSTPPGSGSRSRPRASCAAATRASTPGPPAPCSPASPGPVREAVLLNAGAALAAYEEAETGTSGELHEAVARGRDRAAAAVDGGAAAALLERWVEVATRLRG